MNIPQDVVIKCNDWLRPLLERDGLHATGIGASDIALLIKASTASAIRVEPTKLPELNALRCALLIDMGSTITLIRWTMGPQEEKPSAEIWMRPTARARQMLRACFPNWDRVQVGMMLDRDATQQRKALT